MPAPSRPALADEEAGILACVHCGFCLTACPTYRVLGDENDSPRGRIYLMRALAEGRLGEGGGKGPEAFRTHIDRCLGCRACETACPAGVEYGALLEVAREDVLAMGGSGPGTRLLLAVFARGPATRVFLTAGRWLRDAGLAGWLGTRLPGRAALPFDLLAATRPGGAHEAEPAGWAEATGWAMPDGALSAGRGAGAPGSPEAGGAPFALLQGCVMDGLFDHVHDAARRTLAACGYGERVAPGQGCCGALHAHAGDLETARRLARRNIRAFEAAGEDTAVVTDSAGCGAAMREYPRWLRGDPLWVARARRVADRVRDVSELLAEPPRRPPARLPGRAAYDAPCHLLHGQGIREAPLRFLEAVEGLEVVPLPSSDRCCGGAGIYNLGQPELSSRVLAPKLGELRGKDFSWLLTGNPGCIMQLGAGVRRAGLEVPVLHPVQVLDHAFRRSGVYDGRARGA